MSPTGVHGTRVYIDLFVSPLFEFSVFATAEAIHAFPIEYET